MRNPLMKRIPRELKSDWAKYIVIFLFMILFISIISGFIVADASLKKTYYEGFDKYNIEDGNICFNIPLPSSLKEEIETKGKITLYELAYFNADIDDTSKTIRVYKNRTEVDTVCLMSGAMPVSENEIAIDRLFGENNDINVGDSIMLSGKKLTVTGYVALPDYSCLYENPGDMIFDAINFSVAIMSDEGYDSINIHKYENYAWKYNEKLDPNDTVRANELSEAFIKKLEKVLMAYNSSLVMKAFGNMNAVADKLITIDNYVPEYLNQAITFSGEDMGKDGAFTEMFGYLVTAIIAFIFAVTTSNTIYAEAGTIGTLRASGYTKGELIIHYMILPVVVTLAGAVLGNILGYTVMKYKMAFLYMGSYSLAKYETVWSPEAFIKTTVIPIVLMFVINLSVLIYKLRLSPLRFIKRDLSSRGKKKAFRLNTKLPIMTRFRLRILFQNIPNYITLFIGVFISALICIFGLMFIPMFDGYAKLVLEQKICDYQYVLSRQVETSSKQAEKFSLTSLKTMDDRFIIEEVSVYGIADASKYINADIPEGEVLISNGFSEKYDLSKGDTFTLKDQYTDKTYNFVIADIYDYTAAITVFMKQSDYVTKFEKPDESFTGYFSNEELTDIAPEDIASTITLADLTKMSDQLTSSLGDMLYIFTGMGVVMFMLMMFLLSKQIIEKNSQSISMTKILGFRNTEIGGLYIAATFIVVILSLLASVPLTDLVIRWCFKSWIYTMMKGYIPYLIPASTYIKAVLLGLGTFTAVAVLQLLKISRIQMSDALKNVE